MCEHVKFHAHTFFFKFERQMKTETDMSFQNIYKLSFGYLAEMTFNLGFMSDYI